MINLGIIGCGQMGRKHALNCSKIEGVQVRVVTDKDAERAGMLAREVGAVALAGFEEILQFKPLDAVIIATPPDEHAVSALAAIKAGKAVFVEKPITLDLPSAHQLCQSAAVAGVINAVGFHLRYAPLTDKAMSLIAGRKVNELRSVTTTGYYLKFDMPAWFLQRRHSGGPFLEQTLHMFDVARYLVGDVTHIFARGDRLVKPELKEFDSEDSIVIAYRLSNGALGVHLDSCATSVFNWEIELFGEDWRLLVDYARNTISGYFGEEQVAWIPTSVDIHAIETRAFCEAVKSGNQQLVRSSFEDATKTIAAMLAGDESMKRACQVEVR
ncbi:MAG: Gfo/Idh/MocA family oxidoreductase [Dehalococcoidia bacterium]|nr:Gfo/Idh/MocA family oxidoreductase [Dehalococcoidia bacterium]